MANLDATMLIAIHVGALVALVVVGGVLWRRARRGTIPDCGDDLRRFFDTLELAPTLDAVVRHAVSIAGADAGIVFANHGTTILGQAAWVPDTEQSLARRKLIPAASHALVQHALKGSPEVLTAFDSAPEWQDGDVCAVWARPLRHDDAVVGVLVLLFFDGVPVAGPQAHDDLYGMAVAHAEEYVRLHAGVTETVRALVNAVEARVPPQLGHAERVAALALRMADLLTLSPAERRTLELGALLHDVGKLNLSGDTLRSAGLLAVAPETVEALHPVLGKHILEPVEVLHACLPVVTLHHERWDGTGTPEGLHGTDIPLLARIVSVADGVDHARFPADASPRAWPEARALVMHEAGTRYDPKLVEMLALLGEETDATRV
jgi:HD-GYP domain-containing protein (c-di-GMP phosphodiesterase class II)